MSVRYLQTVVMWIDRLVRQASNRFKPVNLSGLKELVSTTIRFGSMDNVFIRLGNIINCL